MHGTRLIVEGYTTLQKLQVQHKCTQRNFHGNHGTSMAHLQCCNPGRWELVFKRTGKCIQQDTLACSVAQIRGKVAKKDCSVCPNAWFLINLCSGRS